VRISIIRSAPSRPLPRQRDGRAVDPAATAERWLDLQDPATSSVLDTDDDDLDRITELVRRGAPDSEIDAAVRKAREHGWSLAPLALTLGETAGQIRRRLQ